MAGALEGLRIAFIGGGVMGEAIARGLLGRDLVAPEQLVISEPVAARREHLALSLGVHTTDSNREAVQGAHVVVFAVKPQVLGDVLTGLEPDWDAPEDEPSHRVSPEALVLSIVAGARIERYVHALRTRAVVRVMPNTPGQIGQGASLWTATPETSEPQRAQARELVEALGVAVYSPNEDDVDKATALSGSGPAYVFLFIEAMTDAGVQMGLSRDVAATLALQTVLGSAAYAREAGEHPAVLRNRVTSPGGTTAAALFELEKGGFRALVAQAIVAAYTKAHELGEVS
jgi:pyrroline-5-carboxylate reductase